jgi:hypothetical protein
MWKWMQTSPRNYDNTGHLLLRLSGILSGCWIGTEIARDFEHSSYLFGKLALLVSVTLFWFAYHRAKTTSEPIELRTK